MLCCTGQRTFWKGKWQNAVSQVSRLYQNLDTALKFICSVLGAVGRVQKHKRDVCY